MTQQTSSGPVRIPHAVPDPNTRLEIAKRAQAGELLAALATEYGVSTRTVQRYRDALSGGE
jgi:hypothetical protein